MSQSWEDDKVSYQRYGLAENPYQTDPKQVLQCHSMRKDRERFVSVHPLVDERKLVRDMRGALIQKKGVFYAIVGTSGSGRTVAARRIFTLSNGLRAAQARRNNKSTPKVVYCEQADKNLDARQVCRGILLKCAGIIDDREDTTFEAAVTGLRQDLNQLWSQYTIMDLADVARRFLKRVYNLDGTLNWLIEDVPTAEVFRGVRQLFEDTQAVVVCTIRTEQSAIVLGLLEDSEIAADYRLELDKLSAEKAVTLAKTQWRTRRANGEMPFHEKGLLTTFQKMPRTVGKSLGTLSFALESKLTSYPGDSVWPADTGLGF